MTRTDVHGPGPVTQALVRADTSPEVTAAAKARLVTRTVGPLATEQAQRGMDRPQLRAELAVATLIGVTLARSLDWFEMLAQVSRSELVALLDEVLSGGGPPP